LFNFNNPTTPEKILFGKSRGNSKIIITGKNQYFKPNIVNKNEFQEMVSRHSVDFLRAMNNKDKKISEGKEPNMNFYDGFPLTDEGLHRYRKAHYVGAIPLDPKKRKHLEVE